MKRFHGGDIGAFCDRYGCLPEQVLDFSTNVNFLGAPSSIEDAIRKGFQAIGGYSHCGQDELARSLASYLRIPQRNILLGNGSASLIFLISKYLQPRNALIISPTFCEYGISVKAAGGNNMIAGLSKKNDFALPIHEVLPRIDKADAVYVCNPNNPTGTLFDHDDLLTIADKIRCSNISAKPKTLIIDEAFIDFAGADNSLRWNAVNSRSLMVLGSLTKFFAIPGLRLGYLVAHSALIDKLKLQQDPWSINCFAETVGKEVLEHQDYIETSLSMNCKNREYLTDRLVSINGLKPYPSFANFILVELDDQLSDVTKLQQILARDRILIRNCNSFGGLEKHYMRLTVKSRQEIDYLISSLRKAMLYLQSSKEETRKHTITG